VRRPNLVAALILALLAIAFFFPAMLPGKTLSNSDMFWFDAPWLAQKPASLVRPSNPEFGDTPAVLQPFTSYTIDHLPSIPLWNPHIMTGRPFVANMQSAVFSPFNIPAYLFGLWPALAWIAALKLFTAAFGAYLLGRAVGMRFAGALLAGVAYGFNLWMVTWVSYPHSSVWALIPWLMLAADRVARRPDRRSAALLALVVGVQFLGGHPESSFHALLATTIFFAWRAWGPQWKRPAVAFTAALAVGAALAALVLLPFGELLWNSADLRQREGTAAESHLPVRNVLEIFFPDQHGRPTQTPLILFLLARAFYAGALPLMLAAAALLLRPTRGRVAVAAAGAGCLAIVLGVPPLFDIVTAIPPFSSGHNTRLIVVYLLALAMLAGWGFDDLLAGRAEGRRRAVLVTAAAIFTLPIVYAVVRGTTSLAALGDALRVAWGFVDPPGDPATAPAIVRGSALFIWVGVGAAALGVVALALRRRGALVVVLAVTLLWLDLARAGMGYNPAIDRDVATRPATPAIRMLQRASPERYVAAGNIPQTTIPMTFGLYEARGYDLPVEQRFDRLWRTRLSPEFPSQAGPLPVFIPLSLPKVTEDRLPALRLMGVTHILQPPGDPEIGVPGVRLVHDGPDARLYALDGAAPRATVVGAQQVVGSPDAALDAATASGFDPTRTVVTEKRLPGLPEATTAEPAGTARIVRTEADRLEVEADAERDGLLVVSDAWFPGWTATVDGRAAEVERVNYVFRGVRVGPGTHRVEFAYRPLSWRVGWIVSVLALLAIIAALALPPRTGRRRTRARPA
jgi:Bacterial membrane protein YfhO